MNFRTSPELLNNVFYHPPTLKHPLNGHLNHWIWRDEKYFRNWTDLGSLLLLILISIDLIELLQFECWSDCQRMIPLPDPLYRDPSHKTPIAEGRH